MNYIEMYKNDLIPNLNIDGLIEQKRRFESDLKRIYNPCQAVILQMIKNRLNELKAKQLIENLKN